MLIPFPRKYCGLPQTDNQFSLRKADSGGQAGQVSRRTANLFLSEQQRKHSEKRSVPAVRISENYY